VKTIDFKSIFKDKQNSQIINKVHKDELLSKFFYRDNSVTITTELLAGDGVIIKKKMLFIKEEMLNFRLKVSITGIKKITNITGELISEGKKEDLGNLKIGINSFDIPLTFFSSTHLVTVNTSLTYKVRRLTYKKLNLTVSRNY
jgi:hypothetical protein